MNRNVILFSVVVFVALGLTGVAVAGMSLDSEGAQQAAPRAALTDIGQLQVFARSSNFSAPELASLEGLKTESENYPTNSLAGRADFSTARPFAIPGGEDLVWIAQTSDGGICSFMPQLAPSNAPGYSSGCSSLKDFNETGVLMLNFGENNDYIAVAVQPNDVAAPVIKRSDGTSIALPVQSNVAIGILSGGDAITSGGLTLSTAALEQAVSGPKITR